MKDYYTLGEVLGTLCTLFFVAAVWYIVALALYKVLMWVLS